MTIDVEQNAKDPRRVTADGETAEQHPIPDQIAADKYANQQAAAARDGLPFFIGKFRPPGAV